MYTVNFTLFIAWLITFIALLRSNSKLVKALQIAVASQKEVKDTAVAIAGIASNKAKEEATKVTRFSIMEKLKPIMAEVDKLENIREDQKKFMYMLAFLKEHPGLHVEQVEDAIQAVKENRVY